MNDANNARVVELATPTNGGKHAIEQSLPYTVNLAITGDADLLFHRWNCEAVDTKAKAAKNSAAKKSDDIESYLWRNESGELCLPGEYVRQSIIHAAKYRPDPRSPRKSAMDLFKAGVVSQTHLASLSVKDPDYIDTRRVTVQRAGINRSRPAMRAGWTAKLSLLIVTPEYIDAAALREVLSVAGRLVGVGDFRPSFGRFSVTQFAML